MRDASMATASDEALMGRLFEVARGAEADVAELSELDATVYARFIAAYEEAEPRLNTAFVRVAV